jgi:hypothetical protein
MQRWFYARDKQQFGPYSPTELKDLAAKGVLQPSDKLHQEGSDQWVAASSVKGLFRKPGEVPDRVKLPTTEQGFGSMGKLVTTVLLIGTACVAGWFALETIQLKARLAEKERPGISEPVAASGELTLANQKLQQQQKSAQSLAQRVTELEESNRADKSRIEALEKQLGQAKESVRTQAGDAGKLEARLRLLTSAGDKPYYEPIDHYALQTPPEAEQTIDGLAKYLIAPAENDREKVRAIFRWVTDRLTYNVEAYLVRQPGDNSVPTVFKTRKCVCSGYAALMEALGRSAGLDIVVVRGYSRGYTDFYALHPEDGELHAWNAVKVDGKWQLLDATYAGGAASGKDFIKRFNDVFFLISPAELIHTHFPRDPKWQLLDQPIKRDEFEKLNRVRPIYLARQEESRTKLRAEKLRDFVIACAHPDATLFVLEAPPRRQLLAGTKYTFRFESDIYTAFALFKRTTKLKDLTRNGQTFEGEITPERGELSVFGKLETKGGLYWKLLEYEVQ